MLLRDTHHLKEKAISLEEHPKLLMKRGYILIHDAFDRMIIPVLSKAFVAMAKNPPTRRKLPREDITSDLRLVHTQRCC